MCLSARLTVLISMIKIAVKKDFVLAVTERCLLENLQGLCHILLTFGIILSISPIIMTYFFYATESLVYFMKESTNFERKQGAGLKLFMSRGRICY